MLTMTLEDSATMTEVPAGLKQGLVPEKPQLQVAPQSSTLSPPWPAAPQCQRSMPACFLDAFTGHHDESMV